MPAHPAVAEWVASECRRGDGEVPAAELWERFLKDTGQASHCSDPVTRVKFGRDLTEMGFPLKRRSKGSFRQGLLLNQGHKLLSFDGGKQDPPERPDVDVTGEDAPDHLSPRAAQWWSRVVRGYALEEHHRRLLTLAAELWDRAQQARQELAEYGSLTFDSPTGPKPHPCVTIADKAAASFGRILKELALPEPEEP